MNIPKPKGRKKKKGPLILSDRTTEENIHAQLERVILSEQSPVDLDELALELYEQIGGARGFVGKLMIDLNDQVHTPLRARIMELALRLLNNHATRNTSKDTELATDEELERVAKALMNKIGIAAKDYEWPTHYCI